MLAIFDIDGTICDTQEVEGRCYAQAFEEIFDVSLQTLDWSVYEEPTSSRIIRSILGDDSELIAKEEIFKNRFVELLAEEQPKFPGDFTPIPGAAEFITQLSVDPAVTVAFATGGFDTEAAFKLKCCGIDLSDYPYATSSDTPRRRDILPLAAKRAGIDLSSAVYFGDAPWDVKACDFLDLPMIGIGRRIAQLRELGLQNTFRDFTQPDSIYEVFCRINKAAQA